jgi:outer membrane murein-binding lipoprotein Lpp
MSKQGRPRPQSTSSDDDERIGRKVEDELTSSDSDTDKKTITNTKPKAVKKPRDRLPISRRTEIIQNKQRGIDDPEYCCTQNPKTKSWTVRKRKFPLDQTLRHDTPLQLVPPKKEEPVVEAPVVEEKKKDDLELTWANTQARNDKLADLITELSAKFDKLDEKREKAKERARLAKLKAKKEAPKPIAKKEEEYSYYSDDEPPARPAVPAQRRPITAPQAPVMRKLPVGVYRRAGPLSISQF